MNLALAARAAGRTCPADYLYAADVFDRTPDLRVPVLYVVGGLYGNLEALDAVERLAASEAAPVSVVFNGDFHWFDAHHDWFEEIERRVTPYRALRGNVETEIARAHDVGAGCGCAYPADVDDGVVQRSNEILSGLRKAASLAAQRRLRQLPMHFVVQVGALRVGIVHGDGAALAGWRFAHNALDDRANREWLDGVRRASRIDVFASTHTCLAALRDMMLPGGRLTIVNSGAAGMPNFSASKFGLMTRIATVRSPHRALYGLYRDGVYIDTLALHYDTDAFLGRFLTRWPEDSSAHESYFKRIATGPDYPMARAVA